MYKKMVPFKDLNDKPQNKVVHFNLFEREVMKLLPEFQTVFKQFGRSDEGGDVGIDLTTEEAVEFYTAFETILLAAYGVPSDDGLSFNKSGRFDFEESALFNACMMLFVTDPTETGKLIDGLMPKGLQEMVKNADENLAKVEANTENEALKAEVARLRAQMADAGQN